RENVRVISTDSAGRSVVCLPLAATYGEPSGDVMHSVMLVDPQPPVAEKSDLERLTEIVDQGAYDSDPNALGLMQQLIAAFGEQHRSEEHTSELQSREKLVCRLLLERKK